ncbi:MAG: DUF4253 domain-containing protein [Myxococcaceae bacterium]|nr:DUF4253 domain-containing protein [Myxococcaceae bacterium]
MAETWRAPAEQLLTRLGTVRQFSTRDFGREQHREGLSVVIGGGGPMVKDDARAALDAVRKKLPVGCVAWLGTTRWLGAEKFDGKVELAIAQGVDQFDILRHAASDAVNFGLGTEDLVKKLAAWDRACRLDIIHAETDTIEFDLKGKLADPAAFAQEVYAFCPDVVDQGVGSEEALAEVIVETGRVYLWWD